MTASVGSDLFDGVATAEAAQNVATPTDSIDANVEATTDATTPDATSTDTAEESDNTPVETVAEQPDGTVSVTDFARLITQRLMLEKLKAGQDLDNSEYTVPQQVYQTVRAAKDRIPHVLVKGPEDTEPRVFIKTDEAIEWWLKRRDRLATRGAGTARASARSAEDNLGLLANAVEKNLYAISRQAMWNERVAQSTKLIEKYKGFLKEQDVSEDTMASAIQEATDRFHAEQADKAKSKAKDNADNATPETTPAPANA